MGRRVVGRVEADDGDGAEAVAVGRGWRRGRSRRAGSRVAAVERHGREPVLEVLDSRTTRGSPGRPRARGVVGRARSKSRSGSPACEHQPDHVVVQPRGRPVAAVVDHGVRRPPGRPGRRRRRSTSSVSASSRRTTPSAPRCESCRPRCRRRAGSRRCPRQVARQVERGEPLDLGAGDVVGHEVAALDPEQRAPVGLDHVRLVDAEPPARWCRCRRSSARTRRRGAWVEPLGAAHGVAAGRALRRQSSRRCCGDCRSPTRRGRPGRRRARRTSRAGRRRTRRGSGPAGERRGRGVGAAAPPRARPVPGVVGAAVTAVPATKAAPRPPLR